MPPAPPVGVGRAPVTCGPPGDHEVEPVKGRPQLGNLLRAGNRLARHRNTDRSLLPSRDPRQETHPRDTRESRPEAPNPCRGIEKTDGAGFPYDFLDRPHSDTTVSRPGSPAHLGGVRASGHLSPERRICHTSHEAGEKTRGDAPVEAQSDPARETPLRARDS